MRLGELLAVARELKGWTLRDLEARSGISNALISQIETGKVKNPGLVTVAALIGPLGLTWERVASTVKPFTDTSMLRAVVVGKVTGKEHEGDQCPGMPGAICHACGLGYKCFDPDCPNEKPNPMFGSLSGEAQ
jgi:transcriptional regulator with XRE-family HTH domain